MQKPRSLAPLGMTNRNLPLGRDGHFYRLWRRTGHRRESRALRRTGAVGRVWLRRRRNQTQCLSHFRIQLGQRVLIVLKELPRILTPLADALAFVAVPGAGFLYDIVVRSQIE